MITDILFTIGGLLAVFMTASSFWLNGQDKYGGSFSPLYFFVAAYMTQTMQLNDFVTLITFLIGVALSIVITLQSLFLQGNDKFAASLSPFYFYFAVILISL